MPDCGDLLHSPHLVFRTSQQDILTPSDGIVIKVLAAL